MIPHRLRLAATLLLAFALTALRLPADTPSSQKTIKDAAEYNSYITALNTTDPAQKAAAMEAFVGRYPNSIVKVDALEQALSVYQQMGNTAKVEGTAERILTLEPDNIRALAIVTFIRRTRATSGDKKALEGLRAMAERGLAALPAWTKPEGMSDAEFARLTNQMANIFHGAAGFAALQEKDYAAAREHYLKAVASAPADLQDIYQLGIAELQMKPRDANGFWHVAKAINLAKNQGNTAGEKAINNYGRSMYRNYHGSDKGWDELVAAAAGQDEPPENFAKSVKPKPTPAELAVDAVRENDPAELSFSDREFILAQRDASPENKEAAAKVWQSIRAIEKDGKAKLKIPVRVITATKETLDAAITDENQQANKADLHVLMETPLADPPKPGAMVDVVGVLTDYTPEPFLFLMEKGELAPGAQASEK